MIPVLLSLVAALPVGEKLTYRVKYGPLTAGTLTLQVAGVEEVAGESCYHLVSHLRSNPDYAVLFTLDDRVESYARTSDLVTLRTEKQIRESHYEASVTADFDYVGHEVRYSDGTSCRLEDESRDVLSLWYYFRTQDLEPGDEFLVPSHVDKRNHEVEVSVGGESQVRTRLGVFDCLEVEMQSTGAAGNGTILVSDDDDRVPVVIKTKMALGYITATLTSRTVRDRAE
jgi:hypothetical protein